MEVRRRSARRSITTIARTNRHTEPILTTAAAPDQLRVKKTPCSTRFVIGQLLEDAQTGTRVFAKRYGRLKSNEPTATTKTQVTFTAHFRGAKCGCVIPAQLVTR